MASVRFVRDGEGRRAGLARELIDAGSLNGMWLGRPGWAGCVGGDDWRSVGSVLERPCRVWCAKLRCAHLGS